MFDHIIVGAGSIGLAVAYSLTKRGARVVLVDRFSPPHEMGSHHGSTRLIRHGYADGDVYIPLVSRAKELWLEIQARTSSDFYLPTGAISISFSDDNYMQRMQESLRKHSIPFWDYSTLQAQTRWPMWHFDENQIAIFEPEAGTLLCEQAVSALSSYLAAHNAQFQLNCDVMQVIPRNDGQVDVLTTNGVFSASSIILTAGLSNKQLLADLRVEPRVTHIRKSFVWLKSDNSHFGPRNFPAFVSATRDGLFYGFPAVQGRGVKVGRHDGGEEIPWGSPSDPFTESDLREIASFVQQYLPKLGIVGNGAVCHYDMTPDAQFVVDRVPDYPQILFATGFSGHGFKFAPVIGERLSSVALGLTNDIGLPQFALSRFGRSR